MSHPARGPKLCLGIDGKANAGGGRRAVVGEQSAREEAAA
jgi:hypothetical protein